MIFEVPSGVFQHSKHTIQAQEGLELYPKT